MDENQVEHYIKNIKISGHLCLNIDENPKDCRILFRNIVEKILATNIEFLNKITLLELPTNNFEECDYEIISNIAKLSNLNLCLIKGGRYGKNGTIEKGELKGLPDHFSTLLKLNHLDLCFNSISTIPKCLKHLQNLRILNLNFNNISKISKEFSELPNLTELYLRNNAISHISKDIQNLTKLQVLNVSGNMLTELPNSWKGLKSLTSFDVSDNKLENLPKTLFSSTSLQYVIARHNFIDCLPDEIEMPMLITFDIQFNHIVKIPIKLQNNSMFLFNGNTARQDLENTKDAYNAYDVPKYIIDTNISDLNIDPKYGAHFCLPLNIEIIFPKNVSDRNLEIFSKIMENDDTNFLLNDTDQLLSKVLELTPSGLKFLVPVKIILPFSYTTFDQQRREIVIRTTTHCEKSGFKYEDLSSMILETRNEGICCKGKIQVLTSHFSMFAVISRLIENKVTIERHSDHTLFSTVDNFTKIHFPKQCVPEDTQVKIQLLSVDPSLIKDISKTDSYASNILHVKVEPNHVFEKFVTVHIALPKPLMGRPFDSKDVRLLKSQSNVNDWKDITNDVNLIFTTVDASFQTRSFSKYWLVWENICGVARKIYKRLTNHEVQFIALQKKELPSIVKAQCVHKEHTKSRIEQLKDEGYAGGDCYSSVHFLQEGDRFRVKVIGDIKLKTYNELDRKYMEEKILVKRFFSQYSPDTSGFCSFCIESQELESSKVNAVTGYVSFYKIQPKLCSENKLQPEFPQQRDIPSTSKRKHLPTTGEQSDPDNIQNKADNVDQIDKDNSLIEEKVVHLDDVMITLKKNDLTLNLPETKEYELNFGELGTGMFKESNLRYIAQFIGMEWENLGSYLNISQATMDRIKLGNPGNPDQQVFLLLKKWAMQHMHEEDCVESFMEALKDAERTDLAHKVEQIYKNGAENFRNSMKRRKEN